MIVDGKMIAREIEAQVKHALSALSISPVLAIVIVGEDPVIENFVRMKKKAGMALGVLVREYRFSGTVSEGEVVAVVLALSENKDVHGIIVQLPLPKHIDPQAVLDAIPVGKDVDVLSFASVSAFARGDAKVLPPVAGAIQEILERADVHVSGKEALVLGHGRLVGIPAALLLRHNDAHVTVIDRPISDLLEYTRESDIIISGVGSPGLITPTMLHEGVVLIDAGTSEEGGRVVGDAEPLCAEIASVFTPVPGGIGPITIAMIFKNLVLLAQIPRSSS